MKTSVSSLSNALVRLNNKYNKNAFSSSELINVLKEHCGRNAKAVLNEFENHGVVLFVSSRRCMFICVPTVSNIENLI